MAPSEMRKAQQAQGPATILAIGTANPSKCIYQADYPDYYFRITKSQHMVDLKKKFKRICDKSRIRKRYVHLTEEFLTENPKLFDYKAPTLDVRQDLLVVEVPKLGKEAANKAIKEWNHPKSDITHLIFCTNSCVDMPGADYHLANLLGLQPSVKRYMMYQQGCHAGATVLRLAKDLAENNSGARGLLRDYVNHSLPWARRNPHVGQAIFGDGAAADIVGSDPDLRTERPLFEIMSASQMFVPETEGAITGRLTEAGLMFHLGKDVPRLVSENIESALMQAFSPLGINITEWNSIFWMIHPGGAAILDQVEVKLGLKEEKMRASRHVLSEYGNMSEVSVLFVIDEMRRRSEEDGAATTGEWGVVVGFGPGLTVETVVLHSLPTTTI